MTPPPPFSRRPLIVRRVPHVVGPFVKPPKSTSTTKSPSIDLFFPPGFSHACAAGSLIGPSILQERRSPPNFHVDRSEAKLIILVFSPITLPDVSPVISLFLEADFIKAERLLNRYFGSVVAVVCRVT